VGHQKLIGMIYLSISVRHANPLGLA